MNTDLMIVDGDLAFNHDISIVTGDDAILQSAIDNIQVKYGEIPICDDRGNKLYNRRIRLTDTSLKQVEADCKDAILYDERIADVPYIKATRDGTYGCGIVFVITTKNNTQVQGTTAVNLV